MCGLCHPGAFPAQTYRKWLATTQGYSPFSVPLNQPQSDTLFKCAGSHTEPQIDRALQSGQGDGFTVFYTNPHFLPSMNIPLLDPSL